MKNVAGFLLWRFFLGVWGTLRFLSSKSWQDDATRRGFVNVSFGHLTIAATVEQPLGHSLKGWHGRVLQNWVWRWKPGMITSYITSSYFDLYISMVHRLWFLKSMVLLLLSQYPFVILFRVVCLQYCYNASSSVLWLSKIESRLSTLRWDILRSLNEGMYIYTYVAARLW